MEILIEKMLGDFEHGRLSRRQLAVQLAAWRRVWSGPLRSRPRLASKPSLSTTSQ
jgi:hypothetical protein